MRDAGSSPPFLEALMGMRYVLALSLILHQCGYLGATTAVPLAFVLSGFILVHRHGGLGLETRAFWVARLARLYPLYLLGLLGLLGFRLVVGHGFLGSLGSAVASLLLVQAWIPERVQGWNDAGWAVSDLAFFYLLFPLLAPILLRWRSVAALLACIVLSWVVGVTVPWVYAARTARDHLAVIDPWLQVVAWNPLCHLPEFVIGMAVGALHRELHPVACPRVGAVVSAVAALVIVALTLVVPGIPPVVRQGTLVAPFGGLLIWGLLLGGGLARPLACPGMVALGRAAYAFTILQEPVALPFFFALGEPGWEGHRLSLVLVLILLLTLVSLALSRWFEGPASRWVRAVAGGQPGHSAGERPGIVAGLPLRECLLGLALMAACAGYAKLLPQRMVAPATRVDRVLARLGIRDVAWDVAAGDERYLRVYHERVPWVRFACYDSRRQSSPPALLLVGRRAWENRVRCGATLLEWEEGSDVVLWAMPSLRLQRLGRIPSLGAILGVEPLPDVEEAGFHAPEHDSTGRKWRWTSDRALLVVPLATRPARLAITAAPSRETPLEICVNGCMVWRGRLEGKGPVEWVIALPSHRLETSMRLELISRTFVPHEEDPGSGDTRSLGIPLTGLMLLP